MLVNHRGSGLGDSSALSSPRLKITLAMKNKVEARNITLGESCLNVLCCSRHMFLSSSSQSSLPLFMLAMPD